VQKPIIALDWLRKSPIDSSGSGFGLSAVIAQNVVACLAKGVPLSHQWISLWLELEKTSEKRLRVGNQQWDPEIPEQHRCNIGNAVAAGTVGHVQTGEPLQKGIPLAIRLTAFQMARIHHRIISPMRARTMSR